jgi:hypothetical protein
MRMTRPQGHQSALRYIEQLATSDATLACCVALTAACFVTLSSLTCFASMKKHLAKGCHYASNASPHDSSHVSPRCRKACSRRELLHVVSLVWKIISGLKGRRLGFPLWNAHAAAPDSNPLLREFSG